MKQKEGGVISNAGIDAIKFSLSFSGKIKDNEIDLLNSTGQQYATLKVRNQEGELVICLPRFIRQNNAQSFSVVDMINIEMLKYDVDSHLRVLSSEPVKTEVKTIEINITDTVCSRATINSVLNLLNNSMLSKEKQNLLYVNASKKDELLPETAGMICKQKHYYIFKGYNKTIDLERKTGCKKEDVPDNLLRLEIVLLERTIQRLYGNKNSIDDILCKEGLLKAINEYDRTFVQEILNGKVKPYLKKITLKLVEIIQEEHDRGSKENKYGFLNRVIAQGKDYIVDARVLQRALSKFYRMRGIHNHSNRDTIAMVREYELNEDVILTLQKFRSLCGEGS